MAYRISISAGAHTSLTVRSARPDGTSKIVVDGDELYSGGSAFISMYYLLDPGYSILGGVFVDGALCTDEEKWSSGLPTGGYYYFVPESGDGVIHVYTYDAIGTKRNLTIVEPTGATCTVKRTSSMINAPLGNIDSGDSVYCGDWLHIEAKVSDSYEFVGIKLVDIRYILDNASPTAPREFVYKDSTSVDIQVASHNRDCKIEILVKPKPHAIQYGNYGNAAKIYAKRVSSPEGNPLGVLAHNSHISNGDVLDFYVEVYDGSTIKHLLVLQDFGNMSTIGVTPIAGEVPTYISETSFTVFAGGYKYLQVAAEFFAGRVCIDNGSKFGFYGIYIDNGTKWNQYVPYIDNGTGWDICS